MMPKAPYSNGSLIFVNENLVSVKEIKVAGQAKLSSTQD
jgi:hypothetical protein